MKKLSVISLIFSLLFVFSCEDEKNNDSEIKNIIFISNRDGNEQIYKMDEYGNNLSRLTNNDRRKQNYFSTYFSNDGNKIVYNNLGSFEGVEDIYIINTDGTNETKLTNNNVDNEGYNFNPMFSYDGTKIFFGSNRNGCCDLFMMDVDGNNQTNLTNDTEFYSNYRFSLSPDGSVIVYTWNVETTKLHVGIGSININDNTQTQLSNDGGHSPQFSPDGSKIVFVKDSEIYIMNSDGSNHINLTDDNPIDNSQDEEPQFSPDGSKILFISYHRIDNRWGIYIMDSDGNNQTRLTFNEGLHPQFSPDGSKIVYVSDGRIYIMNVDGSNQTKLTQSGEDGFPQFQPLSK